MEILEHFPSDLAQILEIYSGQTRGGYRKKASLFYLTLLNLEELHFVKTSGNRDSKIFFTQSNFDLKVVSRYNPLNYK